MMTPGQARKMFEQAMKDVAPKEHRNMRQGRKLDWFLNRLTKEFSETREFLQAQAVEQVSPIGAPEYKEDPMELVQEINSRFKMAEDTAITQAIEQIEALRTTESA